MSVGSYPRAAVDCLPQHAYNSKEFCLRAPQLRKRRRPCPISGVCAKIIIILIFSSHCKQHKWWSCVKTCWVQLCWKMSKFPIKMSNCTWHYQKYSRPETYLATLVYRHNLGFQKYCLIEIWYVQFTFIWKLGGYYVFRCESNDIDDRTVRLK